jgi:DNA-binding HxlR family transcriptional regulator
MPSIRPPRSYGSFCPVAQASEVFAQRWVPLIVREIMVGYHRFNEIRRALPLISPSVLAQRLKLLEDEGVIRRRVDAGGVSYQLTEAGEELRPIVDQLGRWAQKWITRDYRSEELDPALTMWAVRRHVLPGSFPPGRTVLHIVLDGEPARRRYWWFVIQPGSDDEVDVCMTDPGHAVTLTVTARLRVFVDLLLCTADFGEVVRTGAIGAAGDRELARRLEALFDFSEGSGVLPDRMAAACDPMVAEPAVALS